jgi:hypothetical protein
VICLRPLSSLREIRPTPTRSHFMSDLSTLVSCIKGVGFHLTLVSAPQISSAFLRGSQSTLGSSTIRDEPSNKRAVTAPKANPPTCAK